MPYLLFSLFYYIHKYQNDLKPERNRRMANYVYTEMEMRDGVSGRLYSIYLQSTTGLSLRSRTSANSGHAVVMTNDCACSRISA